MRLRPAALDVARRGRKSTPPPTADYYYRITPLPTPDDIELEVGGLATLPNGNLAAVTRRGDLYETVYAWPLSGHYHEYSFGPVFAPDGSLFVTLNVAFGIGNRGWWRGESPVPWRGWALRIGEDGSMQPWATGLRSPAGYGMVDGEFFYTENQGD